MRSACVLLSKHTNPEDILLKRWKEIYFKHIKVWLWNDAVSKSQSHMPDIQEAKLSVGHTLGSAEGTRYSRLQYRWKREGFPTIVIKCVHQHLGDKDATESISIVPKSHAWFFKTYFLKTSNPLQLILGKIVSVIPRYSSVRRTSTVISMVKASSQANQSMQSTDRVAHRACFPQSNSLVKIPHSNDQRGAHPSAAAQLHPGISPRLG